MTTQTTGSVALATTPTVNLLPPEIAEAAKFRRFQAGMGVIVLAAGALVGVLYVGAHHSVSSAQSQLQTAQTQTASLQQQVNALQSVSATYNKVADAKNLLAEAMAGEVRWSYYLEDLSLRIPDSVWLTGMTITPGGAAGSTGTSTVPTTSTGTPTSTTPSVITPPDQIATISFSGYALSHDDVAKWLNAIASEKGWSDPYVTSINETFIGPRQVQQWTGTVDVTSAALSGRYTQSGS